MAVVQDAEATPVLTLPLSRYADPDGFALEVETCFRREWLLVGRADTVPDSGDYLALDVVGEPLLVIRGADGRLRCVSRLCTHRNMPLVPEGLGHADRLTCGYHLWTFRADGTLIGAPLTRDLPGFDPGMWCLPEFPLAEWLGFVFVCLDRDASPFAPRVEGVTRALAPYRVDTMQSYAFSDVEWPSNWKLGVENASESYHHAGAHAATVGPHAPPTGSWICPGTEYWALHRTRIVERDSPRLDFDDLVPLPDDERAAFRCYTIFPSTVILVWGASCNWLSFLPLEPHRTRLRTGMLYPALPSGDPRLDQLQASVPRRFDQVNGEDRNVLAALQRVTTSRAARPGPLVAQEGVVAALHEYVARRLAAAPR